ncbi:flagellar protein FlgN [Desulfobaculum senezii]|jgi:flagellar biosynthesis/type III secretory pathway chaperone
MLSRIKENIHRQNKAMDFLHELLEEEFSHLTGHDPQQVTSIELSLQELLRQIAMERVYLRQLVTEMVPEAANMADLTATLTPEEAAPIQDVLDEVDAKEQVCAVQAEKNAQLAVALVEQSTSMLEFMHQQIQPKQENTYGRSGRYAKHHPQAALLKGRL